MIAVISRNTKNSQSIYLYDSDTPKKYIEFALKNTVIEINAGTIEAYEPNKKSNFRSITLSIPGDLPEEIYDDIPDVLYNTNPLYFSLFKLFRAIKGQRIRSDNLIVSGQSCLEIMPTVNGFDLKAQIDLLVNRFSENQMHLEVNLYNNDRLSEAIIKFYQELSVIASQNNYSKATLSKLLNLINIVRKSSVDFTPIDEKPYIITRYSNNVNKDNNKKAA